jgi:hypothetical protein
MVRQTRPAVAGLLTLVEVRCRSLHLGLTTLKDLL